MDLVCLYTNHWFLSFVIILIILHNFGIELSGKKFITTVIIQYLIVQALWDNHGKKCLNAEREILDKRLDRLNRG